MSLIQLTHEQFAERCKSRGVDPASVAACVFSQDARTVTLDDTHPDYAPLLLSRPSAVLRAFNFTKAAARHAANRGRQCTDDEIAARYAICRECPLLVDDHCTHKKCGCGISPKRAIVSKLSWASEKCPDGKW